MPDRYVTIPDPDPNYSQTPGRGSNASKPSPGPLATTTEVHYPDGSRETLRLAKRVLSDGSELFLSVDGSGRCFRRRPAGIGVVELDAAEVAALFPDDED